MNKAMKIISTIVTTLLFIAACGAMIYFAIHAEEIEWKYRILFEVGMVIAGLVLAALTIATNLSDVSLLMATGIIVAGTVIMTAGLTEVIVPKIVECINSIV